MYFYPLKKYLFSLSAVLLFLGLIFLFQIFWISQNKGEMELRERILEKQIQGLKQLRRISTTLEHHLILWKETKNNLWKKEFFSQYDHWERERESFSLAYFKMKDRFMWEWIVEGGEKRPKLALAVFRNTGKKGNRFFQKYTDLVGEIQGNLEVFTEDLARRKKIFQSHSLKIQALLPILLIWLIIGGIVFFLLWKVPGYFRDSGTSISQYLASLSQGKTGERPPLLNEMGKLSSVLTDFAHRFHQQNRQFRLLNIQVEQSQKDLSHWELQEAYHKKELVLRERDQKDGHLWATLLEKMVYGCPLPLVALDHRLEIQFWSAQPGLSSFPVHPLGVGFAGLFSQAEELEKKLQTFLHSSQGSAIQCSTEDGEGWQLHLHRGKNREFALVLVIEPISQWEEMQVQASILEESLRSSQSPLVILDTEGYFVFTNPAFDAFFAPPSKSNSSIYEMDLPAEHPPLESIKKALEDGENYSNFFLIEKSQRLYHLLVSPIGKEGELLGAICHYHPIPEVRREWENLKKNLRISRDQEEMLSRITNDLPIFLFVLEGRKIQQVNSFFLEKTGWGESEILGEDFSETLFAEKDWERLEGLFLRESSQKSIYSLLMASQKKIPVELHLLPGKQEVVVALDMTSFENLYQSYEEVLAQVGKTKRKAQDWRESEKQYQQEIQFLKTKIERLSTNFSRSSEESDRLRKQFEIIAKGPSPSAQKASPIPEKKSVKNSVPTKKMTPPPSEITRFFLRDIVPKIEEAIIADLDKNQNLFEVAIDENIEVITHREGLINLLIKMFRYSSRHTYSGNVKLKSRKLDREVIITIEDDGPLRTSSEMAILEREDIENLPNGPIVEIIKDARKLKAILSGKSDAHQTSLHLVFTQ